MNNEYLGGFLPTTCDILLVQNRAVSYDDILRGPTGTLRSGGGLCVCVCVCVCVQEIRQKYLSSRLNQSGIQNVFRNALFVILNTSLALMFTYMGWENLLKAPDWLEGFFNGIATMTIRILKTRQQSLHFNYRFLISQDIAK